MLKEKMGLAKGEVSEKGLGNPPHEDDTPAPKKEEAPHHGTPQPEKDPEEKEVRRERHEKESKGYTEVEQEHKRGVYDAPIGQSQKEPLIRPPERSPGDKGPKGVPGIDNKGFLGSHSLNDAFTKAGVSTSASTGRSEGILTHTHSRILNLEQMKLLMRHSVTP